MVVQLHLNQFGSKFRIPSGAAMISNFSVWFICTYSGETLGDQGAIRPDRSAPVAIRRLGEARLARPGHLCGWQEASGRRCAYRIGLEHCGWTDALNPGSCTVTLAYVSFLAFYLSTPYKTPSTSFESGHAGWSSPNAPDQHALSISHVIENARN